MIGSPLFQDPEKAQVHVGRQPWVGGQGARWEPQEPGSLLLLRLCLPLPAAFLLCHLEEEQLLGLEGLALPTPRGQGNTSPVSLPVRAQPREGLQRSPQRRTENSKLADRGPSEKPTLWKHV